MNTWSSVNKIWEWLASSWENITTLVALNFPDTPADGDTFGPYQWDNTRQVWTFTP